MLAEVAQGLRLEERRRRRRHHDLPSVRERSDSRAAVYLEPDVSLGGQPRHARVQAGAHANGPVGERVHRLARGCGRPLRRRERDEERVSLRIDLDAAVRGDRRAHDPPVRIESVDVARRPELVQEPRRALDVSEEECDGARRECVSHAP